MKWPGWLLWGPTKDSHSFFRVFVFRNPSVEQEFQRHCNPLRVMLATAYFTFSALLNIVHAASYSGTGVLPPSFWAFTTAAILPTTALVLLHTLRPVRRQVTLLHSAVALVTLLIFCCMSLLLAEEWMDSATSQLPEAMPYQVVDFLSTTVGNHARTLMAYACQFHLISLAFMGYNHTTIPIWLCFFSAFVIVTVVSPHRVASYIGVFTTEMLLSIIPFIALCVSVELLQRRNFHSQQGLRYELETSQMAEGMLNNTVKNALADAVANIQEYLNAGSHAAEPLLRETLAGLARGMRCCRQRQAFLALVSDTYVPTFLQVGLKDFGAELVAGRAVAGEFVDRQVLLDPLLCMLVLDNAIAQAFQHGHPEGPDVRVRIFFQDLFRASTLLAHTAMPLVFEVSFFCDDDDLDLQHSEGTFCPRGPIPAHNLTQRHLKLAADAHGMSLRWFREEDRICFRATCTAQLVEPQRRPEPPPRPLLDAFPRQLTFYIIDDSVAARRLLATSITRTAAPAAVHCFGVGPQDVHQFVGAACLDGDIVICDQHLDYGEQHYLGSELIRSLKDRGFQGLICIRSADMEEQDQELYRACGAHCVFGKEELCREVVERIKAAYVQLKGLHLEGPGSPVTTAQSDTLAIQAHLSPLSSVGWDQPTERLPSSRSDDCRPLHGSAHCTFTSF